jgi:hypothetical protein
MNKKRQEVEFLVYKTMDALDPTGTNSTHYKQMFSKMSDTQFTKFLKNTFPFRFHSKPFEIEPNMDQIYKAAKILQVPITEKVSLPYLYESRDGKPIWSKECLVIYTNIKKMKQFITKKNSMSLDINDRDMRTGLLNGVDKNGKMSDREFESLVVNGNDLTIKEFSRFRADAMEQKSQALNSINLTGRVSLNDLKSEVDEVLSKNMLDVYFMGAHLKTNLLTDSYELNATIKNKGRRTERETEK